MSQATRTFPPLDLDDVDARLEARAAERGIPTLTATPPGTVTVAPARAGGEEVVVVTAVEAQATVARNPKPPRRQVPKTVTTRAEPVAPEGTEPTPRARMKPLNVELPDYVWVELKSRAARQMVSVRHIILTLLDEAGIAVAAVDLIEDGRRLR